MVSAGGGCAGTFLCFRISPPSGPKTAQVLNSLPSSSSGIDPEAQRQVTLGSFKSFAVFLDLRVCSHTYTILHFEGEMILQGFPDQDNIQNVFTSLILFYRFNTPPPDPKLQPKMEPRFGTVSFCDHTGHPTSNQINLVLLCSF